MRVTGDDSVGGLLRKVIERVHEAADQTTHSSALFANPHARIERDLLVAAAAGVDLVGNRARLLLQLPYDQRVHVLVGGALKETWGRGLRGNPVERLHDL